MKIIIAGCGRVGTALVKALTQNGYDVTVIDKQKDLVEKITDRYSVNGIVGSGASKETLLAAGADSADVMIAVTPVDEINILNCVEARAVGTLHTVARVEQPDFAGKRKEIEKEYNIDYILNPSYAMAELAASSIGFPSYAKSEGAFVEKTRMITLAVIPDSPLAGKSVAEIKRELHADIVISFVLRAGKVIIPKGDCVISEGDRLGLIGWDTQILPLLQRIGVVRNAAKRVMIMGGGATTKYLVDMLLPEKKDITVIEEDLGRCRELMEAYPSIHVSLGDGEMDEILEHEKIGKADAFLSLTDEDATNVITSMYAWSQNVPSILTRINSTGNLPLLHKVNLDIALSHAEIAVGKIMKFVRDIEISEDSNEIERYMSIASGKAELLLFTANAGFKKLGVPFADPTMNMRKNSLVISIVRDGELVLPRGENCIKEGDRVTVVNDTKNRVRTLNDVFV